MGMPVPSPTEKPDPWVSEISAGVDTSENNLKILATPTVVHLIPTVVTKPTPPDQLRSPPEMPVPSPTEKPDPWVSETSEGVDILGKKSTDFHDVIISIDLYRDILFVTSCVFT